MSTLLELRGVAAGYGPSRVLQGMSLVVARGEIVCLFGRNGVGKSTTLKTVMGWLVPSEGEILLDGAPIHGMRPDRICRAGVGFIPEDRRIFPTLTVAENLGVGLLAAGAAERRRRLAAVYDGFPRLAERRTQLGRSLSGGEQQMLAIGRALVREPRLLLVDEPSEGLAPMLVREIFATLDRLARSGIGVLLVEQNVRGAAAISGRCYVIEKGAVVAEGVPTGVLADAEIRRKLAL
jgi:branched-chain amino acid transport system ATP-binding protein